MIETIFSSLLVAAVSGLTYIAYKHPEPFKKNIGMPLIGLVLTITLFIATYIFGVLSVIIEKLPEEIAKLPGEKTLVTALAANLSTKFTLAQYAFGLALVVVIYLIFLISLPRILCLGTKSDGKNA